MVIRARMNPGTDNLLNDESQLWVVKPSIGRGGVTGLNTLLSGAYIELQPGKSSSGKYFYELLETPPIAPPAISLMRPTSAGMSFGQTQATATLQNPFIPPPPSAGTPNPMGFGWTPMQPNVVSKSSSDKQQSLLD